MDLMRVCRKSDVQGLFPAVMTMNKSDFIGVKSPHGVQHDICPPQLERQLLNHRMKMMEFLFSSIKNKQK